ncbi:hypothetical protein [Teredinibacter sp. KSP-S5-2]|uniref:hypothetical protein n=1 Tax=Teredinibacter sp. KSP-S5-2 TaxID=3034506 RepID=UPI002934F5B6|nr:hypothetical protein [Teredinibacter sp. KSP-S5-2]WNO11484.1 hypothetical protein P5V12_09900 [Teredinibacter sp. KSP-S5-2]
MRLIFSVSFLLFSAVLEANTTCSGPINGVYFNPIGGNVMIDYGYGVNMLCSVDQEYVRVSPDACRALYSGLLAAEAQGKTIVIKYNETFNCSVSELGNFVAPLKEAYLVTYN